MDPDLALQELQRMHETETVRRESVIAWYQYIVGCSALDICYTAYSIVLAANTIPITDIRRSCK